MALMRSVVPALTGLAFFLKFLIVSARHRTTLIVAAMLFLVTLAPEARAVPASLDGVLWDCIYGYETVATDMPSPDGCISQFPAYIYQTWEGAQGWDGARVHVVDVHLVTSNPVGYPCGFGCVWRVPYVFSVSLVMSPTASMTFRADVSAITRGKRGCPVTPLALFPPAGDLCAESLEAGLGKDVNNACPALDPRMQEAKACLDTKIAYALGSNVSTVPEATIRTVAYQNHLLDIYKKWLRLQKLTPEEEVACAAIKSKVDTEKKTHGIGYMPSTLGADAPHVLGLAVDMSENMLYDMASTMASMDGAGGMSLTGYLRNPVGTTQGCKLCWGGTFQPFDPVHIQYCP